MYGQLVAVTAIEADRPAYRNRLRAGDLIFGVNRTRVRTVEEFLGALRAAEPPLRLALVRGEYRITLLIR
jgi:serine protease Do/serine protease DegQ